MTSTTAGARAGPRPLPRTLFASLLLTVCVLAAFSPLFHAGFVNLDDNAYVTENARVQRGLTWENVGWAFSNLSFGYWYPITWLSHMLDCQLFGLDARGHHATSVLIHLCNTLLLFGVLRRMTGAFWRSLLVAALFALHPMHVESVAWLAERKDVLSSLFWILTLWAYDRYARAPDLRRYALVALAVLCGLMAKPMLITVPFVLLLLDYWPLRRTPWSWPGAPDVEGLPPAAPRATWSRLILEKLPLAALSILFAYLTLLSQRMAGAVTSLEGLPLSLRLTNAVASYAFYVGKLLVPVGLAVIYPYDRHALPVVQALEGALLVLLVTLLAVRYGRRLPYFPVGWLWFLGTLVPVIGVVQIGLQAAADRYTYMPAVGLFVLAAWGLGDVALHRPSWRPALATACALWVAVLSALAFAQARYWRSSVTLFTHAAAVTRDNYPALNQLGMALNDEGRTQEALAALRRSMEARGDYLPAIGNMGVILRREGNLDRAKTCFERVIRIKPSDGRAHFNLAMVLERQGREEEALREYTEAVRTAPELVDARLAFGKLLQRRGRVEEAREQLAAATRLAPSDARTHFQLGRACAAGARDAEAAAEFRRAAELAPEAYDAWAEGARLLATSTDPRVRDPQEAIRRARRACEMTGYREPSCVEALALALGAAGRPEEGRAALEDARRKAVAEGRKAEALDLQRAINGLGAVGGKEAHP